MEHQESDEKQLKPLVAYSKLKPNEKRLVNKLITSLYRDEITTESFSSVNRKINRTRRGDDDGRKQSNGYLLFYKERYPQIIKENPKLKVTDIGRMVGLEWHAKTVEDKTNFMMKAKP